MIYICMYASAIYALELVIRATGWRQYGILTGCLTCLVRYTKRYPDSMSEFDKGRHPVAVARIATKATKDLKLKHCPIIW